MTAPEPPAEERNGADTAASAAGAGGTGNAAADAAADRLAQVEDAPLDEHVEIYDDVHRQLQEALADVDEA